MSINAGSILSESARSNPGRVALIELEADGSLSAELSYGELDLEAGRVASALAALGVERGDRVALLAANGRAFLAAFFGTLYAGGVVAPLATVLRDEEAAKRIAATRCSLLLYDAAHETRAQALALHLDGHCSVESIDALRARGGARRSVVGTSGDDPALILHTSGTAGATKAALIGHAALSLHTAHLVHHVLRFDEHCFVLGALPLAHSYGIRMTILAPFYAGGTTVLLPRFDARRVLDTLQRFPVCWLPVVPTMLAALVREGRPKARAQLKWCLSAGAPLVDELRVRAEALLGCSIRQGYGLTEATFSTMDAPNDPPRPQTVGRVVHGVEVRVLSPSGGLAAPGEQGEVVVRGCNAMLGYLDDPEATARVVRDDWIHTGDLGQLDEEGYLRIVGREKDILLRGGNTIWPAAIEEVIATHPAVAEVAVVGRPDAYYGEEIVAVVVPRSGQELAMASLRSFCESRLAPIERPRELAVVSTLPMGASGKVLKRELRRQLAAGELRPTRLASSESND